MLLRYLMSRCLPTPTSILRVSVRRDRVATANCSALWTVAWESRSRPLPRRTHLASSRLPHETHLSARGVRARVRTGERAGLLSCMPLATFGHRPWRRWSLGSAVGASAGRGRERRCICNLLCRLLVVDLIRRIDMLALCPRLGRRSARRALGNALGLPVWCGRQLGSHLLHINEPSQTHR